MKKILVIEDEKRIAELLEKGLTEFGLEVSIAFDGDTGKRLINSNLYDLIITDIILPHHNGFELTRFIKEKYPMLPVIMLTALGATDDKLDGFDAGADDYMVKPFDLRELYARINVLLKRHSNLSGKITRNELRYNDLSMMLDSRKVLRAGKEIKLTPKEFSLLKYLLENPERVLPRAEIAEKVWDTHFDTGTNFIDVYINYLRGKIDKGFDQKLIQTSTGVEFILKSEE
ncbi:response regulator transcription factor [Dysgonomonas macrotermitis]|uniref:DNA-binding response regulator, OmpR family, contains REC and winged-helix (WHTH) domain n=1 Tax=Dysgonomonas macrotermitis TaxID=1346286 RepID=A0A1M5BQK4_9BACT|nr:response regulator transcription factor [Dysgonomonas macrotermitis]SHF44705.1 DNA-binding response regulator, OmpR family, contains REC and winged-helix (wHTH) domain [Dysgonomonas macrotermitis]